MRRHGMLIIAFAMLVAGTGLRSDPGKDAASQARSRGQTPTAPLKATGPGPVATTTARSPRNANYSIDVDLDPGSRTVTGREVVNWRNITGRPTSELQFHLYWNAWRNTQSTWMRERLRGLNGDNGEGAGARRRLTSRKASEWSHVDVTAIQLLAGGGAPMTDLTGGAHYIAPDDGNADDRTVLAVPLPAAVAPGATVAVEVRWTAHVPRTFARTGAVGNFFFMAQWFPKLGVLEESGWNTHQFHAGTEFFSDYGVYDVRITVPRGWIVGATGRERSKTDTPTGKTVHQYGEEDVHDFAWTTSPDFLVRTARFEHPTLPPVEMRLLLQPEHADQAERHFAATRSTLRWYGEWFGPYPYGHVTIVDPAWQSAAGGMEYPTLFTAGTHWLAPSSTLTPEGVTIHECGHQFWYGLVGNNEFEHAWMDEGLNTFSTGRVAEQDYTPNFPVTRFFGGFVPWVFRDMPNVREVDGDRISGYRAAATSDVQATPSWRYFSGTGGNITYNKTALWLHTLERYIGWDRLRRGLSLFFTRSAFHHPTPDDLFAALNEGAGRDLTWYFNEVYRSSSVFDYSVSQLTSTPDAPRGYVDTNNGVAFVEGTPTTGTGYHTEVVARREGDAVFPVDLLVTFADGTRQRERWDGRERWKLYSYDRPARAVSAEIDPDRVLVLDINRTNNSRAIAPATVKASRQWTGRWLVWLQDLALTYGFFI